MRVGVFDSGIGGVTVLRALEKRFSGVEFFYFGDTANVPYGTKSPGQIQSLVLSAAHRMKSFDLDALVIACNTASSLAYSEFRLVFPSIPLVDVVDAGVATVIGDRKEGGLGPVLVLGTRATVRSGEYRRRISALSPGLQVMEQECPLLVPLIEEGWVDHPVLHTVVEEYVKPWRASGPGAALLACTHYPWIETAVRAALPGWRVLNSGASVARILVREFPKEKFQSGGSNRISWFFSDPESVALTRLGASPGDLQRF
jgi:glutamate racemase